MKAIAASEYGSTDTLVAIEAEKPARPQGYDLLVKVKACSVNPVDTKVQNRTYDDYSDYYDRAPSLPQIIGFDGAGIIEGVGSEVIDFQPGDRIFYSGSPIRHVYRQPPREHR